LRAEAFLVATFLGAVFLGAGFGGAAFAIGLVIVLVNMLPPNKHYLLLILAYRKASTVFILAPIRLHSPSPFGPPKNCHRRLLSLKKACSQNYSPPHGMP